MTLLPDLEEFVRNHRPHGRMTADATEPTSNGYRLTVSCACGVVFARWITPEDAQVDLVGMAADLITARWSASFATRWLPSKIAIEELK